MPERIESAVYDGLSQAERDAMAEPPLTFLSAEGAVSWGFEQGAFKSIQHARNAYDKLKREQLPQTAQEMRDLWVAHVRQRLGGNE
jgi:hypothetical protein